MLSPPDKPSNYVSSKAVDAVTDTVDIIDISRSVFDGLGDFVRDLVSGIDLF